MFIVWFIIFLPILLICILVIIGALGITNTMLNSTAGAVEETIKELKNNEDDF